MKWIAGGVTAAKGFKASGVSAGIKRSRKPDLALVVAEQPVTAAAVFTKNRVQAAPVLISKRRVRRGRATAIFINSGCANCLTGDAGMQDALVLSRAVACELGVADDEVLVASTGVIGRRLPVPRIQRAIPPLVGQLGRANHAAAASAILTTDAAIAPGLLRVLLQAATARTFNRISVDGDMSTNDTVFALASGRSGCTIRRGSAGERRFAAMLEAVSGKLARLIVKDGEGAERIMDVEVVGARSEQEAAACARQVANSPLVKTMLAGGDPNVGRIAAAVGASAARYDADELEIHIGAQRVVAHGTALRLPKTVARELLSRPEVAVRINLHAGRAEGRMLACDLTEQYVQINARYST